MVGVTFTTTAPEESRVKSIAQKAMGTFRFTN
jgi:hypothetical protein